MKTLLLAGLVLSCVTTHALAASDPSLEKALKQDYVGKTLILRYPVQTESQYDTAGKLLSGSQEGAWTLYSGIQIRKISLNEDRLRLEGYRTFFSYDARQTAMSYVPDKDSHLKLEVLLEHPCSSLEEATAIIHRIFAITNQDLLDSVPAFWKPFIAKRAGLNWNGQSEPASQTGADQKKPIPSLNAPGLAPDVSPPRAIYTPEPAYSAQARKHKFQGTVALSVIVDKTGRVQRPQIVRAAGMGLDEQAIEIMKKWKFAPALLNGQPVDVEVTLMVAFNLY